MTQTSRHSALAALTAVACLIGCATTNAQETPSQDFRAQAFAAEKTGDLQKAADLFMKLCKAGAKDLEVLKSGARCLEQTGRYNDALDLLTEGKIKFPAEASFQVGLARVFNLKAASLLRSTGRLDQHAAFNLEDSIRAAKGVLKKWPDNRDARLILANSHYTIGQWDEAKSQAQELVKRFPNHPGGHIVMGDLAFEHFKILRRRASVKNADTSKAAMAKIAGARDSARRHYEKALALDETRVVAHRKLGDVYAWNAELKKALTKYADALRIDPDAPISHDWITKTLKPKERFAFYKQLREAYLKRPGAEKTKEARFVWYAAAALFGDKKYKLGEQLYAHSVTLNPTFLTGYYYAMYSAYFYREDEDAALLYASQYAAKAPIQFADLVRTLPQASRKGVRQLVEYLAKRALDKGFPAASRDLNHVLAAIVDTADAWNNYAFMARESQQYAESGKAYRNALEIEPDSGQLMNDLGVILQYHKGTKKDLDEAKQLYKKAIAAAKKVLADEKVSGARKKVARQTVSDATGNLAALKVLRKKAK